jgi:hypothetical protein
MFRWRLLVQEIMLAARPFPDPGGVAGGLKWVVEGALNRRAGHWVLVIDTVKKGGFSFETHAG